LGAEGAAAGLEGTRVFCFADFYGQGNANTALYANPAPLGVPLSATGVAGRASELLFSPQFDTVLRDASTLQDARRVTGLLRLLFRAAGASSSAVVSVGVDVCLHGDAAATTPLLPSAVSISEPLLRCAAVVAAGRAPGGFAGEGSRGGTDMLYLFPCGGALREAAAAAHGDGPRRLFALGVRHAEGLSAAAHGRRGASAAEAADAAHAEAARGHNANYVQIYSSGLCQRFSNGGFAPRDPTRRAVAVPQPWESGGFGKVLQASRSALAGLATFAGRSVPVRLVARLELGVQAVDADAAFDAAGAWRLSAAALLFVLGPVIKVADLAAVAVAAGATVVGTTTRFRDERPWSRRRRRRTSQSRNLREPLRCQPWRPRAAASDARQSGRSADTQHGRRGRRPTLLFSRLR
jgi:hypothetical protein